MVGRLQAEVQCVVAEPCRLGESPVWSATQQALYWTDIPACRVHRWSRASGALQRWELPAPVGSLGLCERGGLVLAMKTGLHLFDTAHGRLEFLAHPEAVHPHNRLNDGKVSPEGRFWVGSMDERPERHPEAGLFRLDADHRCTRVLSGLRVSNGLAWSPDGRRLYRCDTRAPTVWQHDYDQATGAIGEGQVFVQMAPEWGRPDGAAVDAEGCYWNAGIGAGRINRFSPQGQLIGFIELPVTHPTMPCFGGPGLATMYITSLREGLPAATLDATPLAGTVLALDPGVRGAAVPGFKG